METLLRQRMRGLRSVSFQLPCEEDVLPSAFGQAALRAPQHAAPRLEAPRDLRRGGARVLRVAQPRCAC